ncbi:hypothetical protein QTG56_23610 (plasmid) [Rossellomorea sp. AcN35-11]|nr:hypothetical protein [Rossellomorea aquimaris]WJV32351.1 hypothetical protein QTG56_23610 [Rossellomorea sp. AcN35-11]
MNTQEILRGPFNIDRHKKAFTDYLEVIIDEEGIIMYATPSHQEKLIAISCKKLNITREDLYDECPKEYYFDLMNWLCKVSGCIALWNERREGHPNQKQQETINTLIKEGLYFGK